MRLLNTINRVDVQMFLWCVSLCERTRHQEALAKTARLVSRTGDGYLQILLPLIVCLLDPQQGQLFLLCAALGFALEMPTYWVLKNSCQRRRPPEAIPSFSSIITASDRFSFPSGHTAAATLLAALSYLFYGAAAAPLMVWAGMVGASRVVLGVHFPTDILAGAILGISLATLSVHYFTV